MTKIKTKRVVGIILSIVVLLSLATIFYFLNIKAKQEGDTIKEVPAESSIKAEEAVKPEEIGPREYISKYYQEKDRFNAIGASWEEVNASKSDITLYVRVKEKGAETEWFEVYKSLIKEEGKTAYYSAESPILARGDEYQYKIVFQNPENEVNNLKFDVINTMGTIYSRFFDKITAIFNQKASAAAWNPGNIISRSEWGGSAVSVSSSLWPPEHAEKSSKFIVHHTAGVNKSCSSSTLSVSKQDVKAIWSYHTYGRDWGDIGYNYLVDSCGRVFEGRLGGNNVIAGHAAPYNYWDKNKSDGKIDEASIGVSVMGNYSSAIPSSTIIENLGRIIGYKSYINNINPTGSALFKDRTKGNIAGHRDYDSTSCPGNGLQGKLSSIRSAALAHKNLYIASYGNYNTIANNIYLNTARVSMADFSTPDPDDYILATNPAIGEPITMLSALKNANPDPVNLKNVKVIGILDNGTEFVIGNTATLTINPGEIKSLPNAEYNITSFRYQTYKITYELENEGPGGSVIVVENEPRLASASFSYPSIVPHFPNVKLTAGPSSNPTIPVMNTPATLNYTLKNYDARPAYLRTLHIQIQNGLTLTNSSSITSTLVTPGASYTYSKQHTFTQAGSITLRPFYYYGNGSKTQAKNVSGKLASLTMQVLSAPIDYNKISLNSFRVTMENAATVSDSDYILATSPAVGEPVSVRARLRNANSSPIVLTNVRIRGVLDSGTKFTVKTISSLTLTGNSYTVIPTGTFNITSFRTHSFYIDYQVGGKLRQPTVSSSYSYQKIKAHFPNVKVVKTPVFTPSVILIKSPMSGIYKLKNYDTRPAYLRDIRIAAKIGSSIYHFPGVTKKMVPGEVYQYNRSITPSKGGTYAAYAQVTYGNGSTAIPYHNSSTSSTATFKVYTEVSKLSGIPIPATSGKVAREQHLNLVAGCTGSNYLTTRETSAHHYSLSGTPSASRNGMAWETSGGCGYGAWGPTAPSVANERYYINMRWNYTNANGQTILTNKSWYYGKRVVITNPANGKKVVAAVIEYGPGVMTRVAGLSPEAMYAIGATTNDSLKYYWAADQTMSLGSVN